MREGREDGPLDVEVSRHELRRHMSEPVPGSRVTCATETVKSGVPNEASE
ncbi:hypothetical protein [Microbacterium sp. P02]